MIMVDGGEAVFEVCDLGDGMWVGVGRAEGTILSIDSRGVPLSAVRLQRITEDRFPPPPRPELGEMGATIGEALDGRYLRIPFASVRRWVDYWALCDVEADHCKRLARRHGLSAEQSEALQDYWSERIECGLAEKLDDLSGSQRMASAMRRSRLARRLGHGVMFQLWFNTVGPGARTWLGNRYTTIGHYTFRIRWRPQCLGLVDQRVELTRAGQGFHLCEMDELGAV